MVLKTCRNLFALVKHDENTVGVKIFIEIEWMDVKVYIRDTPISQPGG